jgi:hypothetical protein
VPPPIDPKTVEGLRWMGVSEADIAAAAKRAPEEAFGIWDENWDTWLMFQELADRWTHTTIPVGMGGSITRRSGGPAHTEIESTLRLWGLPRRAWRAVFQDIKEMVWAVLEVERQNA